MTEKPRFTNPGDFLRPQDWLAYASIFLPEPPEDFCPGWPEAARRLSYASGHHARTALRLLAPLPLIGTHKLGVLYAVDARVEIQSLIKRRGGPDLGKGCNQVELGLVTSVTQGRVSQQLRTWPRRPNFEDAVRAWAEDHHPVHPKLREWAGWAPVHFVKLYEQMPELFK